MFCGRLDTHTYDPLDDALEPLLASTKRVMNLARLEYISSAHPFHGAALPLDDRFTSIAEADAYIDKLQRACCTRKR